MRRVLLSLTVVAACASKPTEPPVVDDPYAEPLRTEAASSFEECLEGKELPFSASVELELETNPNGFVEKARVTRGADTCFNASALRAVKLWRYPAKLVDGELAARRGIKTVIMFNVEASGEKG